MRRACYTLAPLEHHEAACALLHFQHAATRALGADAWGVCGWISQPRPVPQCTCLKGRCTEQTDTQRCSLSLSWRPANSRTRPNIQSRSLARPMNMNPMRGSASPSGGTIYQRKGGRGARRGASADCPLGGPASNVKSDRDKIIKTLHHACLKKIYSTILLNYFLSEFPTNHSLLQ